MAVDHEKHRTRLKEYSAKSGHNVQYNDGGSDSSGYMTKEQASRADSEHLARRAAVERDGLELRLALKKEKKGKK